MSKVKENKRILNAGKENQLIAYKGTPGISAHFSRREKGQNKRHKNTLHSKIIQN